MSKFSHFSVLIECSTGNTPTVDTIKHLIRMLARMGYNELYLGCTDAYKIEGEPYFNYKRGGYTTADFREMDACAKENGIELMANIQTLGHLHYLQRHESYRDLMDNDNILLVGDERVYKLIDKMFAAISAGLSSRRIHIGYDECWGLGLGNYLRRNGPADKKELLLRHLARVVEIAAGYGYTCEIWHDMLTESLNTSVTSEQVRQALPKNTTVFYWNYFESNEQVLRSELDNMLLHADRVGYAGTVFKCGSMTSLNTFSLPRLLNQMKVSEEKGLDRYMITLWSDNGAWVNNYTVLPALYACSEFNAGRWDGKGEPDKTRFADIVGADYDDMLSFDNLDDPHGKKLTDTHGNLTFLIFLGDLLNGGWDLLYDEDMPRVYEVLADRYTAVQGGNYSHVFNSAEKLARVLALKCRLGVTLRTAYRAGDRTTLWECVKQLKALETALNDYALAYSEMWLHDGMPYGLEVCQMFIGGQILRTAYVRSAVIAYLENAHPIPELSCDTVLPDLPDGTTSDSCWNADWKQLISNCGF